MGWFVGGPERSALVGVGRVALVGPNGIGKAMVAKKIAHQAVIGGPGVRCIVASQMFDERSRCDGFTRPLRMKGYVQAKLLVIGELGCVRTGFPERHELGCKDRPALASH